MLCSPKTITRAQLSPSKKFSAATSKITWTHDNAHSPDRQLPETVGAGCAFFDYDNDGWMDIYLVNSGPSDFFTPPTPLKNALYRNNRDGTFTDVTDKAGVAGGRFGMGVAAADYDGDGNVDLYVTNYGPNILYRNNGNGTFTDVTEKAGVAAPNWSTCATWFDYDNDGKLDLFVSSFVFYDKSQNPLCTDETSEAPLLLRAASLQTAAIASLSQQRRRHVSRTSARVGHRRRIPANRLAQLRLT